MPQLLRTHDVIICKAGGAILHEVLAAQTPAVIDYVVPGQEEGNAAYLVSRNCGVRTRTPAETANEVRRLLANNGAVAVEMQQNMIPVSIPDAARRTAEAALRCLTTNVLLDSPNAPALHSV
jgi:processive 1,2-diacylglycerol beta-glucosyltransferase